MQEDYEYMNNTENSRKITLKQHTNVTLEKKNFPLISNCKISMMETGMLYI